MGKSNSKEQKIELKCHLEFDYRKRFNVKIPQKFFLAENFFFVQKFNTIYVYEIESGELITQHENDDVVIFAQLNKNCIVWLNSEGGHIYFFDLRNFKLEERNFPSTIMFNELLCFDERTLMTFDAFSLWVYKVYDGSIEKINFISCEMSYLTNYESRGQILKVNERFVIVSDCFDLLRLIDVKAKQVVSICQMKNFDLFIDAKNGCLSYEPMKIMNERDIRYIRVYFGGKINISYKNYKIFEKMKNSGVIKRYAPFFKFKSQPIWVFEDKFVMKVYDSEKNKIIEEYEFPEMKAKGNVTLFRRFQIAKKYFVFALYNYFLIYKY